MGMDELLAFDVEGTAEWREKIALEHPNDAGRNKAAANTLRQLAEGLRALEGSPLHQQLDELLTGGNPDAALSEIVSQASREVGFRRFPDSAAKFLEDLIDDLQREVNTFNDLKDHRTGVDLNSPAAQSSNSTCASVAAERIMVVARHLRSLRINSLAEDIGVLEDVGDRLMASSSRDDEKSLVEKALMALGSIFDQLGSERGAQIVISGAVAGLVGRSGGQPRQRMF